MELLINFFGVDKDGRRNWYKPENCSLWWQETGLPFKSVNQTEGTLVKVHRVIRCNLEHVSMLEVSCYDDCLQLHVHVLIGSEIIMIFGPDPTDP
jgi:hypothetical protein